MAEIWLEDGELHWPMGLSCRIVMHGVDGHPLLRDEDINGFVRGDAGLSL